MSQRSLRLAIRNIVIIGFSVMLLLAFTGCSSYELTGIEKFTFKYTAGSAMYEDVSYRLVREGEEYKAILKKSGVSSENADVFTVDEQFVHKLTDILTENKVEKWNGFDKSSKIAMDGQRFDLNLVNHNGEELIAYGSMKWPRNYHSVKSSLDELFMGLYITEAVEPKPTLIIEAGQDRLSSPLEYSSYSNELAKYLSTDRFVPDWQKDGMFLSAKLPYDSSLECDFIQIWAGDIVLTKDNRISLCLNDCVEEAVYLGKIHSDSLNKLLSTLEGEGAACVIWAEWSE